MSQVGTSLSRVKGMQWVSTYNKYARFKIAFLLIEYVQRFVNDVKKVSQGMTKVKGK